MFNRYRRTLVKILTNNIKIDAIENIDLVFLYQKSPPNTELHIALGKEIARRLRHGAN